MMKKRQQISFSLIIIMALAVIVILAQRRQKTELVQVLPESDAMTAASELSVADLATSPSAFLNDEVHLVGGWSDTISRRASMAIDPATDGRFEVAIVWGSSAWQSAMWTFTGAWDETTQRLNYSDGVYKIQTFTDDGEMSEEVLGSNQSGYLQYQNGFLVWHDDTNGPGEGATFEYITSDT